MKLVSETSHQLNAFRLPEHLVPIILNLVIAMTTMLLLILLPLLLAPQLQHSRMIFILHFRIPHRKFQSEPYQENTLQIPITTMYITSFSATCNKNFQYQEASV